MMGRRVLGLSTHHTSREPWLAYVFDAERKRRSDMYRLEDVVLSMSTAVENLDVVTTKLAPHDRNASTLML